VNADLREITVTINGVTHQHAVEPRLLLVDFIRDVAQQTGTHIGCEDGVCGGCTVEVNGATIKSCMMLAIQAHDAEVTTIEGLSSNGELSALQAAFLERGALQCGYCTPGMIMASRALLRENPSPNDEEIRRGLTGNLCRCGTYQRIIEAVREAAAASQDA
jgi:carbon-monoxide dehydrogenase small subunit